MSYDVNTTPTVTIDHIALTELRSAVEQPGVKAALVGFGEYSKHLINMCPDKVLAIYDPNPLFQGIRFRGVPVIGINEKIECNLVVGCEYRLIYDYMRQVVKNYPNIAICRPARLHYIDTGEIKVFDQEQLYREIFSRPEEVPVSMMALDKLKFLLELVRFSLKFSGCVVEMGSWQGGSTWYMAKLLQLLGETRNLYAMDLFETHPIHLTATVCTDEVRRRLAFYPGAICLEGLIDNDVLLSQIEGEICFAHVDLGCVDKAMQFLWDRMPSGAPILLDNYGHAAATWDFEDFFDGVGAKIIRFPWSEQGLVFRS